MKTFILITLLYTLIFVFGINAFNVTISDRDLANYEKETNIKKNIKFNGKRLLDVYYDKNDTKNKKKVVIYIYGSAWTNGDKIGQTKIGSLLQSEDYVAVIPNYVLFPNGCVEDMVDDVYKAINWTYKNISKYGGDKKKIYVCGHSSGAHLTALTLIKSTLHLKNKGIPLKSLPALKKIILLNGPYAFDQEFIAYNLKSLGGMSPVAQDIEQQLLLQQLMVKYIMDESISPVAILKKLKKNSISNKFNVEKLVFFYTSDDAVIPESSSKQLMTELLRISQCSLEYIYEEGLGHSTITDGVRDDNEKYNEWLMNIIRS
ncbi:alpha/beta-hydrolase [Neocallimastix lanati (nom. inval.)]|uniref:Alpha/beta-hydrolase n=1 Tax=Neocallimastix californiae TaxID=1754190 RepID=A0A1Y2CGU4_9FUNG|nr:alpha/beta-hydrolase [Neocallimastix sp. JGI-2020a]ORY46249.1 alpha/beta-hydrolase [Neocallimastix californiae]|eukprot:ORY46249.1 alpha/beta-hydrolase [Neocallimastix californiae]